MAFGVQLPTITTTMELVGPPRESSNEWGFVVLVKVLLPNVTSRITFLYEILGGQYGAEVWQRPSSYAEILDAMGKSVPANLPPAYAVDVSMGYIGDEWIDVHGAGAQRSDRKGGDFSGYTYVSDGYYFEQSSQGDAIRIYNYVRMVRDADVPSNDIWFVY